MFICYYLDLIVLSCRRNSKRSKHLRLPSERLGCQKWTNLISQAWARLRCRRQKPRQKLALYLFRLKRVAKLAGRQLAHHGCDPTHSISTASRQKKASLGRKMLRGTSPNMVQTLYQKHRWAKSIILWCVLLTWFWPFLKPSFLPSFLCLAALRWRITSNLSIPWNFVMINYCYRLSTAARCEIYTIFFFFEVVNFQLSFFTKLTFFILKKSLRQSYCFFCLGRLDYGENSSAATYGHHRRAFVFECRLSGLCWLCTKYSATPCIRFTWQWILRVQVPQVPRPLF